jgi:hypothetical protein
MRHEVINSESLLTKTMAEIVTRKRNNCRPLHINNELWQYRWGKIFVTIYTPQNKRLNILERDIFVAHYGEESYKKRLADTAEWGHYSWDKPAVVPSDFDLELLHFTPEIIKGYILKTLV